MIEIDFNSGEAIYVQLRNQIVLAIATNRLQEGESLPSVRQLADDIGVNMHTVNKAYSILKQEGYLKLDRRRGAVIAVESRKREELESLLQDMKLIVARGICRGISKEEMIEVVSGIYDYFDGNDEEEAGNDEEFY